MAANYSPEGACLSYLSMAEMLSDAGFTWNFGPVVDLRGYPDDRTQGPAFSARSWLMKLYTSIIDL